MSETQPRTPSGEPSAGKKSAPVRATKKPARPRILIKVHPEDLERAEKSIGDRLKEEATSGLSGLGVSLGVHALLLLFLALLVVRSQRADEASFEMGWAPQSSDAAAQASRAPVKIGALDPSKKAVEKKEVKLDAVNKPASSPGVPVKPPPAEKSLANRNPRMRSGLMKKSGGSDKTENAMKLALEWIQRQQNPRGNWQLHAGYPDAGRSILRSDCGATALALLAFLGAGHTHEQGEYQETVRKGLNWLTSNQDADGNLHEPTEYGWKPVYYAHSMATIALCEAYALSGDESLREPAIRAIQFLADSQHPVTGGWKYVKQTELTNSDLSVTSWALMAMNTARMAGLEVPTEVFQRTSFLIDSVQERGGSRYKYEAAEPISEVTPARTAVGLLCRQWLGWPKDFPMMKEGVQYLVNEKNLPEWSGGRRNVYAWYYMAEVLHNIGGEDWVKWYGVVQAAILDNQNRRGSKDPGKDVRGSWDPNSPAGSPHEYADQAGRLYLTAMCVLILETPVRHLPIYAVESSTAEPATSAGGDE